MKKQLLLTGIVLATLISSTSFGRKRHPQLKKLWDQRQEIANKAKSALQKVQKQINKAEQASRQAQQAVQTQKPGLAKKAAEEAIQAAEEAKKAAQEVQVAAEEAYEVKQDELDIRIDSFSNKYQATETFATQVFETQKPALAKLNALENDLNALQEMIIELGQQFDKNTLSQRFSQKMNQPLGTIQQKLDNWYEKHSEAELKAIVGSIETGF